MSASVETEVIEILVTGIPAAGKTSFLRTLNPNAVDEGGWASTYIAVDEMLHLRFVEPPSQSEFDYMWLREVISVAEADGFVVICDSARPELFNEMIGVLQTVLAFHQDAPCVVVANKQDHPQAWSTEDIRFALGIPTEIPVVPCIASQIALVREAVIELLYQIFDE